MRGVGAGDEMQAEHARRAEDACKNKRCERGRLPVVAAGGLWSEQPAARRRAEGKHVTGRLQCAVPSMLRQW